MLCEEALKDRPAPTVGRLRSCAVFGAARLHIKDRGRRRITQSPNTEHGTAGSVASAAPTVTSEFNGAGNPAARAARLRRGSSLDAIGWAGSIYPRSLGVGTPQQLALHLFHSASRPRGLRHQLRCKEIKRSVAYRWKLRTKTCISARSPAPPTRAAVACRPNQP